jgi:hypothetical protein
MPVHKILSMRITLFLVMVTTPVVFPQTPVSQTQGTWFGTWKLNLSKSTTDPDSQVKRATSKIEPWRDGLKVTYDIVGVRGGITHMEWTGRFDSKDYPVQGVDYVFTNAYTRLSDRSYQITIKVDGVTTATATVEISRDGKTLTTTTTGKNAQGNTANSTAVYERQ